MRRDDTDAVFVFYLLSLHQTLRFSTEDEVTFFQATHAQCLGNVIKIFEHRAFLVKN